MYKVLTDFVNKLRLDSTTPGICAFVSKNTEVPYFFASGTEKVGGKSITPQSNFRLASITKQFTAVAILQLVERGLLTLDTTLVELFSDFPSYDKSITIQHLLNHTSGIRDYEKSLEKILNEQISDKQVLELAKQDKSIFSAGSRYAYSNGGYCLLKLVVDNISGVSFEEYLEQNIFKPSGMWNSHLNTTMQIPRRVYGYSKKENAWLLTDQNKTSATQGDGGIYSSARDLICWHKSLYEDKIILPEKYLDIMTKPAIRTDQKDYYGCGINIAEMWGMKYYYHLGESIGFKNILFYIPVLKCSVGALSNLGTADIELLGRKLLESVLTVV
ncbi:MAG TPA: class A beta-lactamase-related serine hydrolase [Candidatus Kaiserbacteria bacterium]|nr:class A beta-lactamase-related serine hydrolase [Candidatus Kaiserbacteria bacterium]